MKNTKYAVGVFGFVLVLQACSSPGGGVDVVGQGPIGPGSVTTYHNDLARDGDYALETILKPSNVTAAAFGKVGAFAVDGLVYAQPLVAQGVSGSGTPAKRDLVIVATEHDSVYAFDVDTLQPVWRNNFVGDRNAALGSADRTAACAGCATLTMADTHVPNIVPEVGITATPVIDPSQGVVYVVAASKENGAYHIRLHALDVVTGEELGGGPVDVQGAVPGSGTGSAGGVLTFDPGVQLSRSGLVLSGGSVLFGLTSYDDTEPAHGWLFAYDATTLQQMGIFVATPDSGLGTIWMSGGAPAVDAQGRIYFATGNGDPAGIAAADYDDSIVKLALSPAGLGIVDWFTPYNRIAQDNADVEIGSGGVMLLPDQPGAHPHLLVQAGKEGTIYLVDREHMGQSAGAGATSDNGVVVQELVEVLDPVAPNSNNTGVYSTPTYWNGQVFFGAVQGTLRSYRLSGGLLEATPSGIAQEKITHRGASTSVSSNGSADAVIWMIDSSAYTYDAQGNPIHNGPAVLLAYDPENLSSPLYRSDAQGTLDNAGNAVKFAVPTIAGGRVFVGAQSEVSVYGLRGH